MAADNFKNCLPIILGFEGGRVNDRQDPGGRTNKGITQRTYDAYRDRRGLARDDVYSITNDEVADCYRHFYWDAVHGDELRRGEDLVVFDFAVNSGPGRALTSWQTSGGAGSMIHSVIIDVCYRRLAFLKSLRAWPHFGAGWGRRVSDVQSHGLAMAAGLTTKVAPPARPVNVAGAVAAAGAAVMTGSHLSGSPLSVTGVIAAATVASAIYAWSRAARLCRLVAARAVEPEIISKELFPEVTQ
jgi:lysozyme family protein